ncbi:ABC transporter ATP-binding protein [Streptomyces sp. NPDC059447]|uniref:ABC transporter ATP-binding protein n=1 Tax=Streptomyces sp. NPDC059447 TaxID=3346834 RepID=UPI0036919571
MTAILEAHALGKRYGRKQALSECTLSLPAGRVIGLVGPNGAGKSTLLQLACGLIGPTSGTIEVLGGRPASGPEQLAKVGFVAQDTPTYAGLSIADHLKLGARLNDGWDVALAEERIRQLGLDPKQKTGKLSGGQRAQVALTLAVAKRPELLLLDEPVAALDPLARREFLQSLMEYVAEHGTTVVLSSHLVSDLERVCDHLVSLVASRVQVAGDVDDLLSTHFRLTTARRDAATLPEEMRVIQETHTERQSTFIVYADKPVQDPSWVLEPLGLEDLVLTYMGQEARR